MPENPSIQQLLTDATSRYHAGDYRQAILLWQKVLVSEPSNQRAKEGIRMASLLMDEAQAAGEAAQQEAGSAVKAPETQENIAKVREGIQKVREFLASSHHLEAMELCQSLLTLAPKSAAVHELVEEAREAYEAQPFINEHLEVARQLFVQERMDEATAELHKIFFLNPNHAEARKIQAKIQALRQKRNPTLAEGPDPSGSAPEEAPPAGEAPAPGAQDASRTQKYTAPPDFGDSLDLPQEPPPETPAASDGASAQGPQEAVLNENWEADLAQLDLGSTSAEPSPPPKPAPPEPAPAEEPVEALPLVDLSENPTAAAVRQEPPPESAVEELPREAPHTEELDLSPILDEEIHPPQEAEGVSVPAPKPLRSRTAVTADSRPQRETPRASPLRFALPLVGILIGGGAAWWYFGSYFTSSGGGNSPSPPPQPRAPQHRAAQAPGGDGGKGANLGLSSSGSRSSTGTAAAGVAIPGVSAPVPSAAPALKPEEARREVSRLTQEGRALAEHGKYQEAIRSFSKALDLDPSNMEAKDQLDQAAAKVLEQKRLEEDLQTAKEFFMEKDYESALRKFYRLPKDRNLGELDLFIRNAWYNWAVVSMKGGNCVEALQRLQEVLTADPGDKEAIKQQEVAEHYRDRPKDRIFYAYVDRLTYRTLNQK